MADNADLQVAVAAVRLRRKPESATLAGLNLCTDKINIIKFHPARSIEQNISPDRFRLQILYKSQYPVRQSPQMNPVADIFDRRTLHMLAYLRIQPDPRADDKTPMSEHIIAICNHTIIDLPDPPRLKNPAQSTHRSSRKPEPARQITACPHRNIAQRHHVAGNDSVHDLIHRPVTAHDHNHPCLLAVGRQLPCILCRLPRIFRQICLILNPVPHKPLLYFLPYLIAAVTL